MEWQHQEWLYLILPLAAAWLALSLYSRSRRRRAAEAFVAQAMWSRILPADSRARFCVKLLLREMALVTALVTDQFQRRRSRGPLLSRAPRPAGVRPPRHVRSG